MHVLFYFFLKKKKKLKTAEGLHFVVLSEYSITFVYRRNQQQKTLHCSSNILFLIKLSDLRLCSAKSGSIWFWVRSSLKMQISILGTILVCVKWVDSPRAKMSKALLLFREHYALFSKVTRTPSKLVRHKACQYKTVMLMYKWGCD